MLSVKKKVYAVLSAGLPCARSGGFTSPVSPNSKFSISSDGMLKRAAIWLFVTPSFQSSVRIVCQTIERSGRRPLGSSTPYLRLKARHADVDFIDDVVALSIIRDLRALAREPKDQHVRHV